MAEVPKKRSNGKKKIPEMMPVKKWLSLQEACSYMDMSQNHLMEFVIKRHLTIAATSRNKKYLKVDELDQLIEKHILTRKME